MKWCWRIISGLGRMIHEKTWSQKSCDTAPLNIFHDVLAYRIGIKGSSILTTWWSRPKLKQMFNWRMKENITNLPSYLLSNLCLNSKDKMQKFNLYRKPPTSAATPRLMYGLVPTKVHTTCFKESLGRSKPATNLSTSTLTHCVGFLLYPSLTEPSSIE